MRAEPRLGALAESALLPRNGSLIWIREADADGGVKAVILPHLLQQVVQPNIWTTCRPPFGQSILRIIVPLLPPSYMQCNGDR